MLLSPVYPQQRFAFSPDQLLIQPEDSRLALISPTFVHDSAIYFPVDAFGNDNTMDKLLATQDAGGRNKKRPFMTI